MICHCMFSAVPSNKELPSCNKSGDTFLQYYILIWSALNARERERERERDAARTLKCKAIKTPKPVQWWRL